MHRQIRVHVSVLDGRHGEDAADERPALDLAIEPEVAGQSSCWVSAEEEERAGAAKSEGQARSAREQEMQRRGTRRGMGIANPLTT